MRTRHNDSGHTRHLTYLDFEVEIGSGSGHEYPVTVVRSPGGEARETMRFSPAGPEAENLLQDIETILSSPGGEPLEPPRPEARSVQDLGRKLFDALLTGQVRSRYDVSLAEAARQGKGLRFRLRIRAPEWAVVPWELLYDPRQAEFVCLSRNTPLVRYIELPRPAQPLLTALPLRVLGMVASPSDLAELDVAREKRRVGEALNDLRARDVVELEWLAGQTWRDLQGAMRGGPWHIFYFVGHGGYDPGVGQGYIVLADEGGRARHLDATLLSRLLADHNTLRLVLLNSCAGARGGESDIFSSTAAALMRRGIPAVLAMQYEITDAAAIEFARTLYGALADGTPVDAAVAEGRKAISLAVAHGIEWAAPVLYMRSGDGVLWKEKGMDQETPGPVAGERDEKEGDEVTGDKIVGHVGNVGSGAQVAIGKQIRQVMQVPAALASAERAEIDRLLAALRSQLESIEIPEGTKIVGQEFVGQLERELTETERTPDASVIKVAGDWLLKNIPALGGTLAGLFLNPIVGRVVEAGGDIAAEWVKKRFGGI